MVAWGPESPRCFPGTVSVEEGRGRGRLRAFEGARPVLRSVSLLTCWSSSVYGLDSHDLRVDRVTFTLRRAGGCAGVAESSQPGVSLQHTVGFVEPGLSRL